MKRVAAAIVLLILALALVAVPASANHTPSCPSPTVGVAFTPDACTDYSSDPEGEHCGGPWLWVSPPGYSYCGS